jgi:recombination protein RecR
MLSKSLRQLIDQLTRFPGVGSRTAARYALYLAHLDPSERELLIQSIESLKIIRLCDFCFYPFDAQKQETLCPICRDQSRNNGTICIVEKETDLNAIEEINDYQGRYLIIGPAAIWFDGNHFQNRLKKLLTHLQKESINEVILAINPTTEGIALMNYLKKVIRSKYSDIKITAPRQGLPRGAELEYADPETLKSALRERSD